MKEWRKLSVASVKAMAAAGLSMASVARQLGVSPKVIAGLRYTHSIEFQARRYPRRTPA